MLFWSVCICTIVPESLILVRRHNYSLPVGHILLLDVDRNKDSEHHKAYEHKYVSFDIKTPRSVTFLFSLFQFQRWTHYVVIDFLEVTMFQADLKVKEIQLASDSQILKLKVCAIIYDSFCFPLDPDSLILTGPLL